MKVCHGIDEKKITLGGRKFAQAEVIEKITTLSRNYAIEATNWDFYVHEIEKKNIPFGGRKKITAGWKNDEVALWRNI